MPVGSAVSLSLTGVPRIALPSGFGSITAPNAPEERYGTLFSPVFAITTPVFVISAPAEAIRACPGVLPGPPGDTPGAPGDMPGPPGDTPGAPGATPGRDVETGAGARMMVAGTGILPATERRTQGDPRMPPAVARGMPASADGGGGWSPIPQPAATGIQRGLRIVLERAARPESWRDRLRPATRTRSPQSARCGAPRRLHARPLAGRD